jgi:7-carboxy-7-deazaguanine synthase
MANLDILRPDDELKFVVCTESDYFFAREFISLNKPGVTVNLSPAASLSRRKLAEWVLRDKLNVRLNLQLHKLLGTQ